ncbi:SCO1664 family protein [Nocardioides sp. CER19]|uniref:SCO1664 family protein n=1 Tax=Nocardioides sp. CER19 TaxID=3038538 RepID=UPI0024485AD4|nr:SCO1664 family protein [Nocardioides sp. CER19]MDH2415688.1 SCO1664 family protein [Nocardioides sp. CER19]
MSAELCEGDLVLRGRVLPASNLTFVGALRSTSGEDLEVVYKPIRGERPLWDFPEGNLAHREVAAYLVSEALGWDVVPETWLREGPHGTGMVQRWCHVDETQAAVTIVPEGEVPAGWCHVFDGYGADDEPVSLIHEDTAALRRIAVFDVVVNNADRKGGHVLEMPDGHRYGIDHGICFHSEPKLRTVLWGWAGQPLTAQERDGVRGLRTRLDGDLGRALEPYLSVWDVEALADRCDALLARGVLPQPGTGWPSVPWPPF